MWVVVILKGTQPARYVVLGAEGHDRVSGLNNLPSVKMLEKPIQDTKKLRHFFVADAAAKQEPSPFSRSNS